MLVAVQLSVLGLYLPPVLKALLLLLFRPRQSFRCQSRLPCEMFGQWARWSCWWLSNYPCWDCISRRCLKSRCAVVVSAPDDHFTAGPDCRVTVSANGRIGGTGGSPTVCARIVSPAGVQSVAAIRSAPDDHFTAGPHCCVARSASGRVGGAGRCPAIGAGIVSAAGDQIAAAAIILRPRRSFHCQSTLLWERFGQWARW